MNYPIFGNVSLGSISGNIKLFVNHSGVNNLTGIGYNNNSMTFGVNQSAFAIPEMVINQSGNVGIGTTNPIYTLDINGNVRSSDLRIDNGNIHLGQNAGLTSQGANCVAIGYSAGQTSQGQRSIAIGDYAGTLNQGINSIAIGIAAIGTGGNSIAIGTGANTKNFQNSVAIGVDASCNAANQIMLGTINETVSISGYGFTYIPWTNIYYNIGTGGSLSSVLTAVTTMPTPANNANTKIQYMYSVVGKCLFMRFVYFSTVAGTAGSGNYKYLLPSPYNTSGLWPQILNGINENFHITKIGTGVLHCSGSSITTADVMYTLYNSQNCMAIENGSNDQGSANYGYSYGGGNTNYSFEAMLPLA